MGAELGMVLGEAAKGLAQPAMGAGMGLLLSGWQDRRQLSQQNKLNEQQLKFDKMAMDYQSQKQLEMWKNTSYGAQMEQMEKAGLNPGLMYGMSGGGGTTVGGGMASSRGASAPAGGGEMMGMAMMNAQRALIEAQTEKTRTETQKIGGVDTAEAQTRIESLTQGIQNQKAAARLMNVQTSIAEIEQDLKTDSYEDVLTSIRYAAQSAGKQLGILANEKEISDEVKDEKIALVEGELIGLGIANELKREQVQLTEEQTKATIANVAQGWRNLSIQAKNALTNAINSDTAKMNAQTNLRQFLEQVRNNDYGNEIKRELMDLQKFIQDVPESSKMTLGGLTSVLSIFKR